MFYFEKIIHISEFEKYAKSRKYSKVIIKNADTRSLGEGIIKIKLFKGSLDHNNMVQGVLGSLKKCRALPEVPNKVKEKIGGHYTHLKHLRWIRIKNLRELISIEEVYNLSFSIPKKIKKEINGNT